MEVSMCHFLVFLLFGPFDQRISSRWPDVSQRTAIRLLGSVENLLKADDGFPSKSAHPLHYHHMKGTSPIDCWYGP